LQFSAEEAADALDLLVPLSFEALETCEAWLLDDDSSQLLLDDEVEAAALTGVADAAGAAVETGAAA